MRLGGVGSGDCVGLLLTVLVWQWRKTFKVAELGDEVFPKELDALCYNHGRDRNGRPVQYNIYAQLDPSRVLADEECIQRFIRWRVKIMEETIATMLDFENGIEDIVHVHDYSGVKLLRMDINFKTSTQKIIRVFGDYYPEMLSIKYFINVPRVSFQRLGYDCALNSS